MAGNLQNATAGFAEGVDELAPREWISLNSSRRRGAEVLKHRERGKASTASPGSYHGLDWGSVAKVSRTYVQSLTRHWAWVILWGEKRRQQPALHPPAPPSSAFFASASRGKLQTEESFPSHAKCAEHMKFY